MKTFFTASVIILLFLAVQVSAQQPCKLTPQTAPPLMGFRLGMTPAEAGLAGDRSAWLAKLPLGWTRADLSPEQLNKISSGRGLGVREITLGFLNDRLTAIRVVYDDSKSWSSFSDFQKHITSLLKLPEAWNTMDPFGDAEYNIMNCQDLEIFIIYFAGSRATVRYQDIPAFKVVPKP